MSRKCPKCNNGDILTERRPNGDSTCKGCRYKGPTKEFDGGFVSNENTKWREQCLAIAREWKSIWMNQKGNSEADFQNYFQRAFGVDANMIHHLSEMFDEKHPAVAALIEAQAEIERLKMKMACVENNYGSTCPNGCPIEKREVITEGLGQYYKCNESDCDMTWMSGRQQNQHDWNIIRAAQAEIETLKQRIADILRSNE